MAREAGSGCGESFLAQETKLGRVYLSQDVRFEAFVRSPSMFSSQEINGVLRDQFMHQADRHLQLVKSVFGSIFRSAFTVAGRALSKPTFAEDEIPITSTKKNKSGVLCMVFE